MNTAIVLSCFVGGFGIGLWIYSTEYRLTRLNKWVGRSLWANGIILIFLWLIKALIEINK